MLTMPRCFHARRTLAVAVCALSVLLSAPAVFCAEGVAAKPSPDEVLAALKAGNERFIAGKAENPHADALRLRLAGTASQADYAYATILTCSDSRVPVERIFDAGVMDLFVVRVAGNVCNTDEIGSIEYGLLHVRTPVLVLLGHTQCGAVTAVAEHLQGKGHALERNIPPLVKSIEPAVRRAMLENTGLTGPTLIAKGIEENVWCGIENTFLASPAVREAVASEKVKVVGAIYDVGTGRITWLPENKVHRLLGRVETDPNRAVEATSHGAAVSPHATPKAVPFPDVPAAPVAHEPAGAPTAVERALLAAGGTVHAAPEAAKAPPHGSEPAAEHASVKPHAATPSAEKSHGEPHGGEKEAEVAATSSESHAAGGRPWKLIAGCGVVFVLGLGVALAAHFKRGSPAPAHAHAAAQPPAQPAPAAH